MSGAFGNGGLAGALQLRIDARRHVSRQQQIGIVHVDQIFGCIQVCAGIDQLLDRPDLTLRSPMFDALAQQPHAVHILQKINLAAHAAFVAEVRCCARPRLTHAESSTQPTSDQVPELMKAQSSPCAGIPAMADAVS